MAINTNQLLNYVIIPTLVKINLDSPSARNLLLGTCAQETDMGTYIKQMKGPGLGIFSMEENTHDDTWDNYLKFDVSLAAKVLIIDTNESKNMITNLAYATAMARIKYLRAPDALPDASDVVGLAHYYKQYYNTYQGAATIEQFIENYQRYVNV